MKILSIETSCDETAISILEADFNDSDTKNKPHFKVLGDALYSQADTHADFGGVFPTLAKREHIINFTPLLIKALSDAELLQERASVAMDSTKENITKSLSHLGEREKDLHDQLLDFFIKYDKPEIDAVAVTVGPGLEPALWVGITGAKILAYLWELPIIPTNHMEGHIASILINEVEENKEINFPAVALLISGGHTELIEVSSWGDYKLLGQTRDDAVGEAFDKVARIIGLQYPGGPKISALAKRFRNNEFANEHNSASPVWNFPRPMITKKDCDFSFSGLKTSVLYAVRDLKNKMNEGRIDKNENEEKMADIKSTDTAEADKASLCAEFEQAVTDVLISKTIRAMEESNAQTLIIGGGVSANTYIRESFKKVTDENNYTLLIPQHKLSTDNSVMIGMAGFLQYSSGNYIKKLEEKHLASDQVEYPELRANGNLRL